MATGVAIRDRRVGSEWNTRFRDRSAAIVCKHSGFYEPFVMRALFIPLALVCLLAAAPPNKREAQWRAAIRDALFVPNALPNVFEVGFVTRRGHRPHFVTQPVAAWLERQVDFPNWREADIGKLPATHISAWAQTEHVEMDPLYATEHREGGTRALGTGVPGLGRDDLSVFSEEEWRRQKPVFFHQRWRELAKARIGL